jgi:GNAT superfamily N-acetyltransferase
MACDTCLMAGAPDQRAAGNVTIREARASDLDALVDMWFSLSKAGTEADPRYLVRQDVRPSVERLLADRWLGPGHSNQVWVATIGEAPIGYLATRISEPHAVLDQPETLVVTDTFVMEPHRRKGIGRALIRAAAEYAGRKNIGLIEVGTLALDTKAVAFWRSLGFGHWRVTLRLDTQ